MNLTFEITVIPVADVDRSKAFYEGLGWRLDADFVSPRGLRVVQITPPGSAASIIFGEHLTSQQPGSARGLHLVASDVEAARAELLAGGADVTPVWHDADGIFHWADGANRVDGPHPAADSYGSFVSFDDPDGNEWVVQQIVTRAPGRLWDDAPVVPGVVVDDPEELVHDLLVGAATAHGAYEEAELGAVRDEAWPEWYAEHIARTLADAGYRIVAAEPAAAAAAALEGSVA